MKSETVLLQGLFVASLLACALCFAGMLRAQPPAAPLAAANAPAAVSHAVG